MEVDDAQGDVGLAADELVVPVYLDTNVLLDLLATVEDGFSLVERVTSGQTGREASERSGEAEFGTPSLFHFFRLSMSGKLAKSTNEEATATREAELTHTYGSLLHRLRRYLIEEGLLTRFAAEAGGRASGFVEFAGVMRPNPFTDSFKRLQKMLGFVELALGMSTTPATSPSGDKGTRGQHQARQPRANEQSTQMKAIGSFMEKLTTDVEREGTSTIVAESQSSGYRAVITLFDDYLRDRSMAELLNREFRVLGKVARHLPKGSTENVDLLASSGVAGFPPEILGQLSSMVETLSTAGGAALRAPSTTIDPPVVEVLPIAIYL